MIQSFRVLLQESDVVTFKHSIGLDEIVVTVIILVVGIVESICSSLHGEGLDDLLRRMEDIVLNRLEKSRENGGSYTNSKKYSFSTM